MHTTHEMIQLVATRRVLGAIFAVVHKHSVKIFILNVFSSYFSKSWLCRTGCICDFEDHPSQCIQLLLGSSPANINFKVLEYLVFSNQPRNSFLCTLWWFSIHKGKEALVIFPHTRITWLFSFVFVSNSSRQYLHEYLNEPGKWRLSTCFRKLFLWFPVLPHSVHLWSLRPSSVGTWSMYSYSCLSSCPPASTKWTTTSKEVRQSTKKS